MTASRSGIEPSPERFGARGALLRGRGRVDASFRRPSEALCGGRFQRAVAIHPELPKASDPRSPRRFVYRARALLAAGRPQAALVELEHAHRELPGDPEVDRLTAEATDRLVD